MRRGNFQRRFSPAASPSSPTVALTLAERAQLVESAPTEPGDHLVTLLRPGQPDVFGVVRHDAVGRRLVAVAPTAEDAQAKAKPVADRWAPAEPTSPAGAKAGAPTTQAQKLAAEASLEAERAEYRRACTAAGITSPKLV